MPSALLDQLRRIVGAPHMLTGMECSPYVVDGRAPEAVAFPGTLGHEPDIPKQYLRAF